MDGERDIYRECLRNHAASLGSYATDGCGKFILDTSDSSSSSSPTANLHCAACGCHRNFHRKVTTYGPTASHEGGGSRGLLIRIDNRQHLDNVPAGLELPSESDRSGEGGIKKRFRTKFTPDQKQKMLAFAEKLGWNLQRKDQEDEVERFCRSVGVTRQVFKVWMHNHKNSSSSSSASTGNASSLSG